MPAFVPAWGASAELVHLEPSAQLILSQCLSHTSILLAKCFWHFCQVWRTSFGLGMLPLLFMLYYRIFRLRESAVWRANRNVNVSRGAEFNAMCYHFWHRCASPEAFHLPCMRLARLMLLTSHD